MELMLKLLKAFGVWNLSLGFGFLLLLSERSTMKEDIRLRKGKGSYRVRSGHPIRRFFLLDYQGAVMDEHYVCFFGSLICCVGLAAAFAILAAIGMQPWLRPIFNSLLIGLVAFSALMELLPWRKKRRRL
jgi:hypothetical protein